MASNQINLPTGFEIEQQPQTNVPQGFELETQPDRKPSFIEKLNVPLHAELGAISGAEKSAASFMTDIQDMANVVRQYTGSKELKDDSLINNIAKHLTVNADYWDKEAAKSGANSVDNFVGQVIGSLPVGLAQWEAGTIYGGMQGAAQAKREGKSMLMGAAKGAAQRLILGKMLKMIGSIKNPYLRRGAGAATMGGTAAVEGVPLKDVAAQTAMGAILTPYAGKGQKPSTIDPDASKPVAPTNVTPETQSMPKRDLSKVDLSGAPTGKAELAAAQMKYQTENLIRKPIIQKAAEEGKLKPEDIEVLTPYKGEDWADKAIKDLESKKPPKFIYEQMAQKEQMETDLPPKKDLNQISPPTKQGETIKSAAIKTPDGEIIEGQYHQEAYDKLGLKQEDAPQGFEEGFVTNEGRFVNRNEGGKVAYEAGQIPKPNDNLHSEDLGADVKPPKPPQEPPKPPDVPIEGQPPQESKKITLKGTKIGEAAENAYQSVINRFASIENAGEKAKKLGLTIKPGEDPKLRSRSYLGTGKKAESVLEDKTYKINKEGNIEITGEGLKPIIEDFEKSVSDIGKKPTFAQKTREFFFGKTASPQDLKDYLISRRTIEDLQKPKYEGSEENIVTKEQVAEAQKIMDNLDKKYGENMSIFDKTAIRIYDFQKRVLHLLVDSGNMSKAQYARILKENPNYIPFDRIMDIAEGISGTPKSNKPFSEARSFIRKIKGSLRPKQDVIESVIKNVHRIMDTSERNTVARDVIKLKKMFPDEIVRQHIKMRPIKVDPKEISTEVRTFRKNVSQVVQEATETTKRTKDGQTVDAKTPMDKLKKVVVDALVHRGMTESEAGNYIRKIESQASGGKTPTGETVEKTVKQIVREIQRVITQEVPIESTIFRPSSFKPKDSIEVFVNGKPQYYKVPKNLQDAMTGMNETSSSLLVKILSAPARLLRTAATITPEFIIRNPTRDQMGAMMQAKFGFTPLHDSVKAIADIMNKSDVYYDWLRSGGAYSGFVELSRPKLKAAYKELMSQKGLVEKLNIIHTAQDLSQLMEQATRVAVFKTAKEKGLSDIESGFESREATVDFGVRGSRTKDINQLMAFFNAGVQGTEKTIRTVIKDPVGTSVKGIAALTVPSVILYMINRNDPDFKEIPRWQKDLFWCIKVPGTKVYARVPKPFLYGQVFSSVPERFMEYLDTKDKSAFDGLAKSTFDSVLPTSGDPSSGMLATAVKPFIENATNYNFFRQQSILPQGIENLEPSEQSTKYTSETAKQIGKIINYSPAKIENLAQGYLGGSERYITGVGDYLINSIKKESGQKVPIKPTDITRYPLLYGTTLKSPMETGQAESINKFYKNLKEYTSIQTTYNKMIKDGRIKDAVKLSKENPKFAMASTLNSISKQLGEINKRIDIITKSTIINGSQKSEKIAKLEKQRIALAKSANKLVK